MNQDKINEILSYLLEVMKDTTAMAKTELPIVAKEIVAYQLYSSGFFTLAGLIGFIYFSILIFNLIKRESEIWGVPIFPAVLALLVFFINAPDMIKAICAPRVVVIEQVRHWR